MNDELNNIDQLHLENLKWSDIKNLLDIAAEIKTAKSPVFASKLCHFLRPNIFIVADCRFVKIGPNLDSYRVYWSQYNKAWFNHPDRHGLINQFISGTNVNPFDGYPFKTKICELCRIGLKN